MVYQSGPVSIDEDFARFGGEPFTIAGIQGVDVRVMETSREGLWKGVAIVALMLGVFGPCNTMDGVAEYGASALVIPALAVAIAIFSAWRYMQPNPKDYCLWLVTADGEEEAYRSSDETEIEQIRAELESRIALRG